jgi:hypothetical protein
MAHTLWIPLDLLKYVIGWRYNMSTDEMLNLYQMVNNILLQMDAKETPENAELFEKIRWLIGEMEHKLITMSNDFAQMRDSFIPFAEAYKSIEEEINHRYCKSTT